MEDLEHAAELRHYIRHLQAELSAIEKRSGRPPTPDPIPDHAIVRYIERVKGIDMRRLRSEILPHERRGLLAAGPGRIRCNGYELLSSKGVVVTVI